MPSITPSTRPHPRHGGWLQLMESASHRPHARSLRPMGAVSPQTPRSHLAKSHTNRPKRHGYRQASDFTNSGSERRISAICLSWRTGWVIWPVLIHLPVKVSSDRSCSLSNGISVLPPLTCRRRFVPSHNLRRSLSPYIVLGMVAASPPPSVKKNPKPQNPWNPASREPARTASQELARPDCVHPAESQPVQIASS